MYWVDCANTDLPTITFTIGGYPAKIPGDAWVLGQVPGFHHGVFLAHTIFCSNLFFENETLFRDLLYEFDTLF